MILLLILMILILLEKCRSLLSLTEDTVSLTQCPQGANLQMVLKRLLEPQTVGTTTTTTTNNTTITITTTIIDQHIPTPTAASKQ